MPWWSRIRWRNTIAALAVAVALGIAAWPGGDAPVVVPDPGAEPVAAPVDRGAVRSPTSAASSPRRAATRTPRQRTPGHGVKPKQKRLAAPLRRRTTTDVAGDRPRHTVRTPPRVVAPVDGVEFGLG